MSGSLSPTADRLAVERARRARERDRNTWAAAVTHWQQELDNRRQVHDEIAQATARAFEAMTADNARYGRPIFANQSDPSSVSAAQSTWLRASEQLQTALVEMNRAEALLGYSRQQLAQLEAELGAAAIA